MDLGWYSIVSHIMAIVIGIIIGYGLGVSKGMIFALRAKEQELSFIDKASFFRIVAGLCLLIAIGSASYSAFFIARSKSTNATVINVIEKKDKDGDIWHYPSYEYYLPSGERMEDRAGIGDGRKYTVGDKFAIRYLIESPHESRIDYFSHHWGLSIFMAAASLFLLCLSLFFKSRAKQSKVKTNGTSPSLTATS
jgi:hypothetical protein